LYFCSLENVTSEHFQQCRYEDKWQQSRQCARW